VRRETGAKIKAISEGAGRMSIGSLDFECTENYITGFVSRNNGTNIEATITRAKFQGTESETKCKSSQGATRVTIPALTNESGTSHWCINNVPGEDKVELYGKNCATTGNGVLTIVLDMPLGLVCRYKREAPLVGTFTTSTNHEASTLALTGEATFSREETSSGLCPAASEPLRFKEMKFRLYTENLKRRPASPGTTLNRQRTRCTSPILSSRGADTWPEAYHWPPVFGSRPAAI
jgi:hypothetical protein